MQELRYLPGVTTLDLNADKCIGCGQCAAVCPHNVFLVKDKKASIIDKDGCMECGACANNCPVDAVMVTPGVGCAGYIIQTWFKGKEAAVCC